jgi:transcriptional regulator with XRE-family HTH domain
MQKTFNCLLFFPRQSIRLEVSKPNREKIVASGVGRLIFERRTQGGITKRHLAKKWRVYPEVVGLWERGEHSPRVHYMPAIIAFIGHADWLPDTTFANRLFKHRMLHGLPKDELADLLGVDPRTIARWERGQFPSSQRQKEIDLYLGGKNTHRRPRLKNREKGEEPFPS